MTGSVHCRILSDGPSLCYQPSRRRRRRNSKLFLDDFSACQTVIKNCQTKIRNCSHMTGKFYRAPLPQPPPPIQSKKKWILVSENDNLAESAKNIKNEESRSPSHSFTHKKKKIRKQNLMHSGSADTIWTIEAAVFKR